MCSKIFFLFIFTATMSHQELHSSIFPSCRWMYVPLNNQLEINNDEQIMSLKETIVFVSQRRKVLSLVYSINSNNKMWHNNMVWGDTAEKIEGWLCFSYRCRALRVSWCVPYRRRQREEKALIYPPQTKSQVCVSTLTIVQITIFFFHKHSVQRGLTRHPGGLCSLGRGRGVPHRRRSTPHCHLWLNNDIKTAAELRYVHCDNDKRSGEYLQLSADKGKWFEALRKREEQQL